jgi:hypothetical protein
VKPYLQTFDLSKFDWVEGLAKKGIRHRLELCMSDIHSAFSDVKASARWTVKSMNGGDTLVEFYSWIHCPSLWMCMASAANL